MKSTLTLLFALTILIVKSQEFITFNGEEVRLYPYTTSPNGIFPIIDSLADGKYASYWSEDMMPRAANRNNLSDTSFISTTFHIKNGKKDGLCVLFNEAGDTITKGKFKNDLLDGKWFIKNKNSAYIINYKNGLKHGEFHAETKPNSTFIGEFNNDNWYKSFYHLENGDTIQKMIFKHRDSITDFLVNVRMIYHQKQDEFKFISPFTALAKQNPRRRFLYQEILYPCVYVINFKENEVTDTLEALRAKNISQSFENKKELNFDKRVQWSLFAETLPDKFIITDSGSFYNAKFYNNENILTHEINYRINTQNWKRNSFLGLLA